MYQTVGHQAIDLYAEAMDLPLYRRTIQGSSLDTSKNYTKTNGDEVEDLYELLHLVKVRVEYVVHGLLSLMRIISACLFLLNVIVAQTLHHGKKEIESYSG